MLSREETITVKNGQAETFTVWRTVHGNILQTDQTTQTAYAKSRAWDGKEVASLLALDSSDEGQKLAGVDTAGSETSTDHQLVLC